MEFNYNGYEGTITPLTYPNNRVALSWNSNESEPIGTVSVNLIDADIRDNMVAIDTNNHWHEILQALQDANIIWEQCNSHTSWFCTYPIHYLSKEILDII